MKKLFWLLVAGLSTGCGPSRDAKPVIVTYNFDSGSIDSLTEISPGYFSGNTRHWKHRSSTDDQYYWFYFRMDHTAGENITIKLNNLIGIYRGGPHLIYTSGTLPVYSYDQKKWDRITQVQYDSAAHSLTFHHRFGKDSVWIAYAHPYTYSMEQSFLNSIASSPFLRRDKLGASAEGRAIELLTITDTKSSEADKKVILITTLQHAGEDIGGYFVEGMVKFLLSETPEAAEARALFIYKIVPMMNPDGIFHGMTRLNASMEDLNQEWDDDFTDSVHAPTEPEVVAVKNWIRSWMKQGAKIDLALDVHSQGQQGELNLLHTPDHILTGLAENLNVYWPVEMIPMEFSGSANDCLVKEFHVPAGTFEIPQSNVNGGPYLTPEDYHSYGRGTVMGIRDYLLKK